MKIDIDFSEDNHILTQKHALTLLKLRNFVGVSGVVIHLNSKQLALNGFFFNLMKGLHQLNISSLYIKGCNPTTYKMFKQARLRFKIYKEGSYPDTSWVKELRRKMKTPEHGKYYIVETPDGFWVNCRYNVYEGGDEAAFIDLQTGKEVSCENWTEDESLGMFYEQQ